MGNLKQGDIVRVLANDGYEKNFDIGDLLWIEKEAHKPYAHSPAFVVVRHPVTGTTSCFAHRMKRVGHIDE